MGFLIKHSRTKKMPTSAGFTLVELLVSTALFTVATLAIVGALISLEAASRKARTIRVAADNVSSAVDSMSRSLRMGTNYHCGCVGTPATLAIPNDCPIDVLGTGVVGGGRGDTCMAFKNQSGNLVVYRLGGRRIQRSTDGMTTWLDMTAPEINISTLAFYVGGTTPNSTQPYVTLLVRGVATSTASTATSFDVQTTIAQRTPNFTL